MGERAVYKELITLAATNLDSELEDSKGKAKSRVASSMTELLTALRLLRLSTGSDKGFMGEDAEIIEDDVKEYMMEMMINLLDMDGDLLGMNAAAKENGENYGYTDENYCGIFVALSEFFPKLPNLW